MSKILIVGPLFMTDGMNRLEEILARTEVLVFISASTEVDRIGSVLTYHFTSHPVQAIQDESLGVSVEKAFTRADVEVKGRIYRMIMERIDLYESIFGENALIVFLFETTLFEWLKEKKEVMVAEKTQMSFL